MLLLAPHYAPGEEEELVEETEEEGGEEEEEEEEEDGLEYTTDTPSDDSYMTPPNTGGQVASSPAPSHLSAPGDSDPENNAAVRVLPLPNNSW